MAFTQDGQPVADSYQQPQVTQQQMMQRASMMQPQQQSGWQGNFTQQLPGMLAPYQQVADRISNPYATMSPNSWLARNHPQVASMLDNGFLAAGMVPNAQGPEGAGGGISRAMQGLMGARQFRQQQQMQQAMLPYQMAQQGLAMQDTMSQINERNAMVPFRQQQEDYMMRHGTYLEDLTRHHDAQEDIDRQRGKREADIENNYGMQKAGITDMNKATPDQLDQYYQAIGSLRSLKAPSGGTSETERMVNDEDRARVASGQPPMSVAERNNRIVSLSAQMAGARSGAVQDVTQPPKDMKTFVAGERTAAYGTLPKAQSASDFQTANLTDPNYWKDPQASYQKYLKGIQGQKQQMDVDLSKYEKSAAPRQGVSFSEYQQNRSLYDGSAPNPAPDQPGRNAPKPPVSNSGSNWTPKGQ